MALSRHHQAANRPLSITEIVQQAEDFDISVNVSLQRWIRAGKLLLTEAAICEQDGNLQMAYLYLYRHAILVLERIPKHPDYRNAAYKDEVAAARRAVNRNLQVLEEWKPRIRQQYDRYMQAAQRRDEERRRVHRERAQDELSAEQFKRLSLSSDDGGYDDRRQSLNANEHRELAVDLAHREIRRRDATRATTRSGISPGTVASRRRGIVVGGPDPSEMINERPQSTYEGSSNGVREIGRYLEDGRRHSQSSRLPSKRISATSTYHYPQVPSREEPMDWRTPPLQPSREPQPCADAPPARPSKDPMGSFPPPRPPKPTESPLSHSPTLTPSPPPTARPTSKYTFKPTAFTEAGAPLRTVLLPPDLRRTFLNIAHPNTLRNLETCGILCGTLISNALFINTLVIPDQKSTSDTCDTTEEGDNELFDYCDSHDLLVLGWIHTHPSQSCFLSSRDLHTSSGYQVMMPEAIAIVCAPRHMPDWGIFRLTDPPGLPAVLNCQQSGLFHPHSETDLYTDALRPGHVVEGPGLKFEVVDLRKQ